MLTEVIACNSIDKWDGGKDHTRAGAPTSTGKRESSSLVECRWCITGTPLSRGLEDLYGLFYFLRANPYSERHFWRSVLQDPYMAGCPAGAPTGPPEALSPAFCAHLTSSYPEELQVQLPGFASFCARLCCWLTMQSGKAN